LERRARIRLRQPFDLRVGQALERTPGQEAPFTLAVATAAAMMELSQPDPGDVFLAATAITLGLTLVTGDQQLIGCRGLNVLANQ
jgi:PIN domain nuclease of toxin-antitoxin system